MSLYYELDPADENDEPQLPPLLSAEKVSKDIDVFQKAISSTKTFDTGTVFYSEKNEMVDIAILLNPEVNQKKCNQMIYLLTVAAGDAIGALAPPEVMVTHSFPGYIYLNKGEAGVVNLAIDYQEKGDQIPEWLVLGFKLKIKEFSDMEQDHPDPDITSLETEGAGFISRTRMVESVCRHFLAWLNQWEDEGFTPVIKMWNQRIDSDKEINLTGGQSAKFMTVDENGYAVVEKDNKKIFVSPVELFNEIKELKLR